MPMCRAGSRIRLPRAIDKVIAADRPDPAKAITVTLSGQVETMRESYAGLFSGMALAVVLVYLFLVINFQSWIDPLIVLMAVPFALAGVMWMLFVTADPSQRAGADGNADVHRPDNRQQHSGGDLRQPANVVRRRLPRPPPSPPATRGCGRC